MPSSRWCRAAVVGALVVGIAAAAIPARAASSRRDARQQTMASARGVGPRTVTVGGLVAGTDPAPGADVGAQARFRRANRHGGVAGRTVRYAGTEADGGDLTRDAAAVEKLGAEVFAVVPATSAALDTAGLARASLPFFGSADSPAWNGNRFGFGFTGAQAAVQPSVVSPAWGTQLRSLVGKAQGDRVAIATDDGTLGAARAEQARIALRAAGFRIAVPIVLPAPPAPLPDVGPTATGLAHGDPAAVLLLTAPATTAALAHRLAALGYTGTVATSAEFYQPAAPTVAEGLTVLVPFAPFEQATAANRQLAADVRAFSPHTQVTPAVAAGYWAADAFLAVLARVGRQLTVKRFLSVANGGHFTYDVPGTIGSSSWPAMHTRPIPCGALVQSDGSKYYVVGRYRCDTPIRSRPPTPTKARS